MDPDQARPQPTAAVNQESPSFKPRSSRRLPKVHPAAPWPHGAFQHITKHAPTHNAHTTNTTAQCWCLQQHTTTAAKPRPGIAAHRQTGPVQTDSHPGAQASPIRQA